MKASVGFWTASVVQLLLGRVASSLLRDGLNVPDNDGVGVETANHRGLGDGICSNGFPGVEAQDQCCPLDCGTCGGPACRTRAQAVGLTGDDCCISRIKAAKVYCTDVSEAPCSNSDPPTCSNGVAGVEGYGQCCRASCGTCGGDGCRQRAEAIGLTADDCCARRIRDAEVVCGDGVEAPCTIVDDAIGEGDPHMVGFRGQRFDFTGESGKWYAVVKDGTLQVNMRVTAPIPDLPEITYITGLSVISPDLDGVMHSMVIIVDDPDTLFAECPAGVSPCLGNGALKITLDDELVQRPTEVSLGREVAFGALNIPGECRPFGFEKYWARKVHEAEEAAAAQNRFLQEEDSSLLPMADWILKDRLATNMPECETFVEEGRVERTLTMYQDEHVSFQILTPKFRMRLNYGKLHQLAMRDPTDQFDLPDHTTHQMNIGITDAMFGETVQGILGETTTVKTDESGQPILSGMAAIAGVEADYLVDGALGVEFNQDSF